MTAPASADAVLAFWREAGPDKWFSKDDAFDAAIRDRFLATHEAAAAGQLDGWEQTPEGALALIITLDQFPRNLFRDSPRAFATDGKARGIALRALDRADDTRVPQDVRSFFYLPLMHSESLPDQERCVELYRTLGQPNGEKYAEIHADIIRRFGRFPHRNEVLGRHTTEAEQHFLDTGGFAG